MNSSKAFNKGITWKITTILLKIVAYSFFAIFILIILYPLLWAFISSFKTTEEIIKFPLDLIPDKWTIEGYIIAITEGRLPTLALNSLIYTLSATVITTVIALVTSYAFVNIRQKITPILETIFTAAIFIPTQAIITPLFITFKMAEIDNSKIGIIIIYIAVNLPPAIYLARKYMKKINYSLIETARLDGLGELKILTIIVLPICRPIVVTIAFITYLRSLSEFFIPLILSTRNTSKPLVIGIYSLMGCPCSGYTNHFSALVLIASSTIICYLLFRKSILKGIGITFS